MDTAPKHEVEGNCTITVPYTIPKQRLSDLLCSAVEGGTGYWARCGNFRRTEDLDYIAVTFYEEEASGEKPAVKRIDLLDLARAIEKCPPAYLHHVRDFLAENDDATTADVFVQLAVFGEVIYG